MARPSDTDSAQAADLRALLNRLHWASAEGCYAASDSFHVVARPSPTEPDQRCSVVIAVRPRLAEIALPANIAFVLQSDGQAGLLHYGRLNRVGQAQIRGVAPGRLALRSAPAPEVAQHPVLQTMLAGAWPLGSAGSAFAAQDERPEIPGFQNAAGDLQLHFERVGPETQLLVTASGDQWANAVVPVSWEREAGDGSRQLHQAVLPLSWHQSLACWAGRLRLGAGPILRFAPPQLPLDRAAIATLPPALIRAAVGAAASLPTLHAWRALSIDPAVAPAACDIIHEQLGML